MAYKPPSLIHMKSKQIPLLAWMPDLICICSHKFGMHDAVAGYSCIRCRLTNCDGFKVDKTKDTNLDRHNLEIMQLCAEWKEEGTFEKYRNFFL